MSKCDEMRRGESHHVTEEEIDVRCDLDIIIWEDGHWRGYEYAMKSFGFTVSLLDWYVLHIDFKRSPMGRYLQTASEYEVISETRCVFKR